MRAFFATCLLTSILWAQPLAYTQDTPPPKGYLGIFAYKVRSPILKTHLNLPEDTGLLIAAVATGSPAETAGLKVHDILLSLDQRPLTTMDQLRTLIGNKPPGSSLSLKVLSAGTETVITAVLGERPKQIKPPDHASAPDSKPRDYRGKNPRLALELDLDEIINISNDPELTKDEKRQKVNALVSRNLLEALRGRPGHRARKQPPEDLKKKVEQALAPLPPATQKRLRERLFDAEGNVQPNVSILHTPKGPMIVVEEESKPPTTTIPTHPKK